MSDYTEEQLDRVAEAIAKAADADADYWTDEIAEWENAEEWYREAYPDEHPDMAYEDREQFRKQARAALAAAGVAPQPEPEYEYGVMHVKVDGLADRQAHPSRAKAEEDYRTCGMNCLLVRRIKAGAWEPVPNQEGERP